MPAPNAFTAIRLPLYYFLSGCFFKSYTGFFDFIKRKTNKLLIPFVFWFFLISVLVVYIYSLLGIHVIYHSPVGPFHEIQRLYREEYFFNIPIWFLLCLFEINIIFYFIHTLAFKLFKRQQTLVVCILSLSLGIIGLLLNYYDINLPFFIDSALDATPFFAFGYVCFRHTAILKPNPSDKYIPFILVVLFLFLYFFAPTLKANSRPETDYYFLHHLCGFIGALFIVLLSKWIKYLPVVRWWGRYSIIILILHLFFIKHFVFIFRHYHLFTDQPWTCLLIILALTLACCSAAIPICKRFFPHVTAQKDIIPIRPPKDNTSQECPQNQE